MSEPSACDRASEHDRLWFEKHPGRTNRLRYYVPGEFGDDLAVDPEDTFVEVTEVEPGVRLRRLLIATGIVCRS